MIAPSSLVRAHSLAVALAGEVQAIAEERTR